MNRKKLALNWWNSLTFINKWEEIVKGKKYVFDYPHMDIKTLQEEEIIDLWLNNLSLKAYGLPLEAITLEDQEFIDLEKNHNIKFCM